MSEENRIEKSSDQIHDFQVDRVWWDDFVPLEGETEPPDDFVVEKVYLDEKPPLSRTLPQLADRRAALEAKVNEIEAQKGKTRDGLPLTSERLDQLIRGIWRYRNWDEQLLGTEAVAIGISLVKAAIFLTHNIDKGLSASETLDMLLCGLHDVHNLLPEQPHTVAIESRLLKDLGQNYWRVKGAQEFEKELVNLSAGQEHFSFARWESFPRSAALERQLDPPGFRLNGFYSEAGCRVLLSMLGTDWKALWNRQDLLVRVKDLGISIGMLLHGKGYDKDRLDRSPGVRKYFGNVGRLYNDVSVRLGRERPIEKSSVAEFVNLGKQVLRNAAAVEILKKE